MNALPVIAGAAAVGGLLIVWWSRGLAAAFLAVFGPLTAFAIARGLVTDGISGVMLALGAVPYWLVWMGLYVLRGTKGPPDT